MSGNLEFFLKADCPDTTTKRSFHQTLINVETFQYIHQAQIGGFVVDSGQSAAREKASPVSFDGTRAIDKGN